MLYISKQILWSIGHVCVHIYMSIHCVFLTHFKLLVLNSSKAALVIILSTPVLPLSSYVCSYASSRPSRPQKSEPSSHHSVLQFFFLPLPPTANPSLGSWLFYLFCVWLFWAFSTPSLYSVALGCQLVCPNSKRLPLAADHHITSRLTVFKHNCDFVTVLSFAFSLKIQACYVGSNLHSVFLPLCPAGTSTFLQPCAWHVKSSQLFQLCVPIFYSKGHYQVTLIELSPRLPAGRILPVLWSRQHAFFFYLLY